MRLEHCNICGRPVSDWVDPDWSHGRICRPCESRWEPREQSDQLNQRTVKTMQQNIMTREEMDAIKHRIANAIADELSRLPSVEDRIKQHLLDQEKERLNQPKKEKLSQHDVTREAPAKLISSEQPPAKYFLLDAGSAAARRFFEAANHVQSYSAIIPGTDGVTIVSSTAPVHGATNVLEIRVNPNAPNAEAIAVALAIASGATLLSQQDVKIMGGQTLADLDRYERALQRLARLGNEPAFGNAKCNLIAIEALNPHSR